MDEKVEIQVRAMNAADWPAMHELWSETGVYRGTLQLPLQSEGVVKKKIENPPEGIIRLVAEVDGRVVGASTLHPNHRPRMRHVAGCGVSVYPDYWNQGVGSTLMAAIVDLADNWLNLKRIELEVYVDNVAAIRLYEKFGFVIEGTKRKYAFREGEYVDTHVMARVRD
jgi:L-phenylalanine/L-methionine N-acetyltransferase